MLTKRQTTREAPLQDAIMEFLRDWKANPVNDGNSPTYQDIATALGKKTSRIYDRVQRLCNRGELNINDRGKIVLGGQYILPE